jgi:hypothetical protein
MNYLRILAVAALGLALWFAGCKVRDAGSVSPDSPPTTILTVAPNDSATVNHFIDLRWMGNDPDGSIAGFNLYVDSVFVGFTTTNDSVIAFSAPRDSMRYFHTFEVRAVDNAGLVDHDNSAAAVRARSRSFFVLNAAPTARLGTGSVPSGSTVGTGFRVSISAADFNPSKLFYAVALDDTNNFGPWSADSVFLFADSTIIADSSLFPTGIAGISNAGLTPGPHVIYLRAKDAGNALSNLVVDSVTVGINFRPIMNQTVTGTYGSSTFYPDGSTYYSPQSGVLTTLNFNATASAYHGEINSFAYRLDFGAWSPWQSRPSIVLTDLPPGVYHLDFAARDAGGVVSDTANPLTFFVRLVNQALTDTVLIVAETRRGGGGARSPDSTVVNAFYRRLFYQYDSTKVHEIRYNGDTTRHGNYVSPYDVRNCGLIMWHADDKVQFFLSPDSVSVTLLNDFIAHGGRVILSGWNLMKPFTSDADSASFASTSFANTRLKAFWAVRSTSSIFNGFTGDNGFPGVRLDSTRVTPLDMCWTFRPRGEDIIIGRMVTTDSASTLNNRPAAYIYDQSFRVAVFGVPLYFCVEDDVRHLFWNPDDPNHAVIPHMLQGF